MAHAVSQPNPEIVTPARAAAVLERLGLDWARAEDLRLPGPPIVPLSPRDARDWWVGQDAVVTYLGTSEEFPHKGRWACDCTAGTTARCPHVARAVMVHAWNTPALRPLFEEPPWALQLGGLVRQRPGEVREAPPEGYVSYLLTLGRDGDGGLPVRRELVRFSRRDGRELRPQPLPETLETLEGRIDGLTDADRRFQELVEALTALRRGSVRNEDLVGRLRDQGMEALLHVGHLSLGARRLRPDPQPFVPVLVARDAPAGIELAWQDPVDEVIRVGRGYVVTADGDFRGLPRAGLRVAVETLLDGLPVVPVDDAPLFLERFVARSGVPVSLHSAHLPPTVAPTHVEGRVHLAEVEDGLQVALRFGYRFGDAEAEVAPEDEAGHLRAGDVLILRDRERERVLRRAVEAVAGRKLPAVLDGDAALDLLIEGPGRLGEGFAFYGDEALARYRVGGALKARVSVPTGVDWFDLEVRFECDGQEVSSAEVLESWRAGRRYHRLPDGTLARLPETWLLRHGEVSAELEEVRRAAGGRLAAHAAPLVAELLGEAEGNVERWTDLLARLADVSGVPERDPPPSLTGQLRGYQHQGYRWICFHRDLGLAGCLADDMGLGKTIQAISALLDTHRPGAPPSLVVAPTSVVHNWAVELRRFAPSLRVAVHHGPDRRPEALADVDVVITSYALLRQDEEPLRAQRWTWVILDEAQQIKNPASQVARVARALMAEHRLAMTGTPLENHLLELWSVFEFLMPGFFGSRAAFLRRYVTPIQRDRDPEAVVALRRRLRPFVLRRHKSEVARELPPRQEQTLYCELGPAQRELYERVKATYRDKVLRRVDERGIGAATLSVLEALMRLRQACCDPALLPFPEARQVGESAKVELLLETLEETIEEGHRTLVFSQWPSFLKRVATHLEARGWPYLYLDGSTQRRHELVDRWNDPAGPPVFLISLKAGGSGLNLTGADHVIHLDPWWNPAVEDQATDRAHRIGQTKPVMAYKLVAQGTVEEKILELQQRKRALFEAAVERDRLVLEQLSREDLEAVFAPAGEAAPLTWTDAGPADEIEPEPSTPRSLDALLRPGRRITNADVRDATGWDSDQARKWLQDEVDAGRLSRHGMRRGTWYEVQR